MNLFQRQDYSGGLKIPLANLVSYWKLENSAKDSVGLNHGFDTAMTYNSGVVGQQGVFDGAFSYIVMPATDTLSFTNGSSDTSFSISALVNFSAITNGTIISKINDTVNREYYLLYNTVSNELRFRVFSGGVNTIYKSMDYAFTPTVGVNYYIVATYDGINLKLYVDGVLVGSATSAGTYVGMINSDSNFMIGAFSEPSPNGFFNGTIDEVAVWNKELSVHEITLIGNILNSGNHLTSDISPILLYGNIVNQTDFTSNSLYSTFGNGSKTLNGTNLRLTCSTDGVFTNGISYLRNSGIQKLKITINVKIISALSGTKYGVGVGLKSINTVTINSNCFQLAMAGANTGSRAYWSPSNYSLTLNDLSSNLSMSLNDIIEMTFEQNIDTFILVVKNITTGVTKSSMYVHTVTGSFLPNVNNPTIHLLGGTFDLQKFKIDSYEFAGAKLMCVGDSKTQGYYATNFETTFAAKLSKKYGAVVNNSGGGDETGNVLQKIQEIIDLAPKKVLLNIGSNDKRRGRTYAYWEANYDSIVSQLVTAGIDVYHLLQLNETVLTFADYNTHITSTYPAGKIVNAGTVSLNADGVHPNQTGMSTIYNAIVAQIGSQIT